MRSRDKLDAFKNARSVRIGQRISSIQEFRAILEYERARVDRNNHEFSLLIFKLNLSEHNKNGVHKSSLEAIAASRVRYTDIIGWFDEHDLGILLPYTPADGAWKLAVDICQLANLPMNFSACEVYTYPSEIYHYEK
ncbi:hypothetical protein GWO43_06525 [candidate division KSB1 bacterium]|nr:hypothetical protein [candidate division KSB1 bacterium]NIR72507.1 hypothetical protein [candidate division KSB1 bacterium]NIS23615.1 hypothetical protein [candidate division KSB1 bacterium]NIT70541.1 hypothetical protein [candidate division KSB1 bacterium]NIU24248.1 hypothetical protein [candidate division KSB1 bacterium]